MAPSLSLSKLVILPILLTHIFSHLLADAQLDNPSSMDLITEAMEWSPPYSSSSARISLYGGLDFEDPDSVDEAELGRTRSLLEKNSLHYYISYAALSANRIPCPPRSGRSYYTRNCYLAKGPVRPYHRGCSAITRCRG